ncbi:MAG: glutamine--tRNA ligase/YqeY domain fusion protein [Betaproteobacteria bacterium]|nr:MAG: glutamine--tRNA ligase/YqeY domain fusion protein [Betaproteobacteria bacterium]TAG48143.1 MAG: glutamine--tRNA ligase/YqeY domain fusion protein [Betaproteobacteria bacterium]
MSTAPPAEATHKTVQAKPVSGAKQPANGAAAPASNFIRQIIDADNASAKHGGKVITRFPPEPNGYLHIGHAKSICVNFGIARDYGGVCHLRFDDTNPAKEDVEYEESIKEMVEWLGFSYRDHLFYASNYFDQLYLFAEHFIERGLAYVDSQSAELMRANRGTFEKPGIDSPFRSRTVVENLALFREMRDGKHADGAHVLRLKIDMASPNINLRDPAIYRIRHVAHHRTGSKWCVYPLYDYTHSISDAIERITHSICTLEFEAHRPLYDWVLAKLVEAGKLPAPSPQQIEFARLNLSYTVLSKRKLLELVDTGIVNGWDDPRMMTLAGLRRRGFSPASIRLFAERTGASKAHQWVDMADLERALREDLDTTATRAMAVLDPVKVVIENWPADTTELCSAPAHPHDESRPRREFKLGRELYIEREDFMEVPSKGFFRLVPGGEVRLRYGYIIKCERIEKDADGNIATIFASYDPATKSGTPGGRNVKGAIHWVAAVDGLRAEVRLYDRLFSIENPDAGEGDYKTHLNPNSLRVVQAWLEPSLVAAQIDQSYQFERMGYFTPDRVDSTPSKLVFNRAATLKDGWKPG